MADIDSCYRGVIMVVCLTNYEQESHDALYVEQTLGQLKTRTVDLVARLSYKSTVQKRVGLFAQRALSSVATVVNKLKLIIARTNSIAIWSAETKAIDTKLVSKLERGKAMEHLIPLYISGFIHTTKSLMFATIAKGKATQSGQTYHRSITEKEMTGLTYASLVTSIMTVTIKHLGVISKGVS